MAVNTFPELKQDSEATDRLSVLVDVLGELVIVVTKGSMYSPMVKPAIKYFGRKCGELPAKDRQRYLDAVYGFADLARREDLDGDEYRYALLAYLQNLLTSEETPNG